MIRKVAWLIPVVLMACSKETKLLQDDYNKDDSIEEIEVPVQSDSCFLGDKIMAWKKGEPVWRRDNFNSRDSIHRSEIESLYSNYMIQNFEGDFVIIQNKKQYRNARIFTRIIQFDQNGYQKNDYTYYDLRLAYIKRAFGDIVLAMDDPEFDTHASPTYWTCQTLLLTDELDTLKNARELGRYGAIRHDGMNIDGSQLILNFHLDVGCTICSEGDRKYCVRLDENFEFITAEYTMTGDSGNYSHITTKQLLLDTKHRWTTNYHDIKEKRRREKSETPKH